MIKGCKRGGVQTHFHTMKNLAPTPLHDMIKLLLKFTYLHKGAASMAPLKIPVGISDFSFDVTAGKYVRVESYEEYKVFILKTREKKDRRHEKKKIKPHSADIESDMILLK